MEERYISIYIYIYIGEVKHTLYNRCIAYTEVLYYLLYTTVFFCECKPVHAWREESRTGQSRAERSVTEHVIFVVSNNFNPDCSPRAGSSSHFQHPDCQDTCWSTPFECSVATKQARPVISGGPLPKSQLEQPLGAPLPTKPAAAAISSAPGASEFACATNSDAKGLPCYKHL